MTTTTESSLTGSAKLYAHIVLDRSGSMHSCAADAVGGYNEYLAKLPASARVSLTLFDTGGIDLVRDAVEPVAAGITEDEYVPRASTPLYDAIGRTIAEAEKRCLGFDRVALVILTDGFENASREFGREDILTLLTRKQEQDGWLIVYLGANQDAWAIGEKFGTAQVNSLSFDTCNLGDVFVNVANSTLRYVESESSQIGRQRAGFSADERGRSRK